MKYRSPSDKPIRVTTTLGHVFIVGREWTELPAVCHSAAIAAHCEVDTGVTSAAATEAPKASAEAISNKSEAEIITEAIELMMKRTEDDDFTQEGNPSVRVLSKLCGFTVTRDAMLAVWNPIKAKLAAEAETIDGA